MKPKKRRKKTSKAPGTPVFVSGGGGFALEDEVAAYVMAAMLADQPPFGEEVGRIAQVDWQTEDSQWFFDDLLLSRAGTNAGRVAVSCKSKGYVSSNGWSADAVDRLWRQWTETVDSPFGRSSDLMAVVMGSISAAVNDAWGTLLEQAQSANHDRFIARHAGQGRPGVVGRAIFSSLKCPAAYRKNVANEQQERVALVARTRLWHRDLLRRDSKDRTQAIEWCRGALTSADRSEAARLYAEIRTHASEQRPVGGTTSLRDLVAKFSGRFRLVKWPQHDRTWEILDTRSRQLIAEVGDTIGNVLCLTRSDLVREVGAAVRAGTAVVLEGDSGSGKSAVAKRVSARYSRTLWFHAADFEATTFADVCRQLKLPTTLEEAVTLDRVPNALLVIDGGERLSGNGRRHAARLAALAASAARPWSILLTGRGHSVDALLIDLRSAGLRPEDVSVVPVPVPNEEVVRQVVLTLRLSPGAEMSPSLIRSLRNLAVLDWVSGSRSGTISGLIDVGQAIWDRWLGGADRGARSHVLKVMGQLDADLVSGGVPRSKVGGVSEQEVVDALLNDGVLRERLGRLFFRHDLLGDWARLLLLMEDDPYQGDLTTAARKGVRWGPAFRLLGQWLASADTSERSRLIATFRALADEPSTRESLLEGVIVSGFAGQSLEALLPDLVKEAPRSLDACLKVVLAALTRPADFVMALRRDDPAAAAIRAEYRVPVPELWDGVLGAFLKHKESLASRCPVSLARISGVWLAEETLSCSPTGTDVQAAAELALAAGREAQALLAEGLYDEKRAFTPVFEGVLRAAIQLPDEVAQFALEMACRRPHSPQLALRLEAVKRQRVEELARHFARHPPASYHGASMVGPSRPDPRPPLSDGPASPVDDSFRDAVLSSSAFVRLATVRPDAAQEVLLACCLDDPTEEDARYSEFRGGNLTGTAEMRAWMPATFLRGPWLALLNKVPEQALHAILRLVDIATEEWQRLRLPGGGEENYAASRRWCAVRLEIDGKERLVHGDHHVLAWYRHEAFAGGIITSALMALERWLYLQVDAGRSVDAAVQTVLRTTNSIACLGVLGALARKQQTLLSGVLQPLATSWRFLLWDDRLAVQSTVPDPELGKYFGIQKGLMDKFADQWGAMPHRSVQLQHLVSLYVAAGAEAWKAACERTRSRWQAEIDGGECPEPDEARRLIALLDPANLSIKQEGKTKLEVAVKWPKEVVAKRKKPGKTAGAAVLAFGLRKALRSRLNAGVALSDEQAEQVWKHASTLPETDGEEEDQREDTFHSTRAAAAAALELLAAQWLDSRPSRRKWCERVVKAVSGRPCRPDTAAGLSLFEEYSESFAGEWAVARLAAGDAREATRRVLAEAVTAGEHIIAAHAWIAATRRARTMPNEFVRLCNLIWLWAGLRRRFRGYLSDADELAKEERWRQRTVDAYAKGRISDRPMDWEGLRLRAARMCARQDRARLARLAERDGVVLERPAVTFVASDWAGYRNHGFDWSYLSKIVERTEVLLRPSKAPHLESLGEFDRRVIDLLVHALVHAPEKDHGHDSLPTPFDGAAMTTACQILAGHEDEQVVTRVWRRIAPHLATRKSWAETFFGRWFHMDRGHPDAAERFHKRWRIMIDAALALPEWTDVNGVWSFAQQASMSAMLGLGSYGSNLGLAGDAPHLGALEPRYAEWAHQCLDARFNMTLLCQLLQKPGAVGLRCAALPWIAAALEKSTARFASREDVLPSIAAVCTITWHEHGDTVLTSPATRTAFLRTLTELARHQVPGFRELRDDVEAVLAGVESAASGSA